MQYCSGRPVRDFTEKYHNWLAAAFTLRKRSESQSCFVVRNVGEGGQEGLELAGPGGGGGGGGGRVDWAVGGGRVPNMRPNGSLNTWRTSSVDYCPGTLSSLLAGLSSPLQFQDPPSWPECPAGVSPSDWALVTSVWTITVTLSNPTPPPRTRRPGSSWRPRWGGRVGPHLTLCWVRSPATRFTSTRRRTMSPCTGLPRRRWAPSTPPGTPCPASPSRAGWGTSCRTSSLPPTTNWPWNYSAPRKL